MELHPETCYRAVAARDPRFDGRFFTAVLSTGVFCRPVCPARTPRRENCRFFACAAAAQAAGFRPCKRCRPEAAPGTAPWVGTAGTVQRALRLIDQGALDAAPLPDFAARLGIGERHLRRLFRRHLGTTPQHVARTRRVFLARQLLEGTTLPMSRIAAAAGFPNVRRFNAAMRDAYAAPPRDLRRGTSASAPAGTRPRQGLVLELAARPPFDGERLLQFLAPRAVPGIEVVRDGLAQRTFALDGCRGVFEARLLPDGRGVRLRVHVEPAAGLGQVVTLARHLFDLDADPHAIAAGLRDDPLLAACLREAPGLRVPAGGPGFEVAVRAILGQQVSVRAATTWAARLAERYGRPVHAPAGFDPSLRRDFPTARALRRARLEALGLTAARARAIRALAAAVDAGDITFEGTQSVEVTTERLLQLPGIGPWTAAVIAMRALRDPDAFPFQDLGVRQALGTAAQPAPVSTVRQRATAWRPWRAYATQYLWQCVLPASRGARAAGTRTPSGRRARPSRNRKGTPHAPDA